MTGISITAESKVTASHTTMTYISTTIVWQDNGENDGKGKGVSSEAKGSN